MKTFTMYLDDDLRKNLDSKLAELEKETGLKITLSEFIRMTLRKAVSGDESE